MTVDGLEKAGTIRRIEITKHINEHSLCTVELLVENKEQWKQLQSMMDREVLVEDDQYIYMRGMIKSISGKSSFSKSVAVVKIVSLSENADRKKNNRIFQNPQKTYEDIFSCVMKECDTKVQIVDNSFRNLTEPKTVVQYNETDFSFITKTASRNGYHVFINDTDKICIFNVGRFGNQTQKKIDEEDIIYLSYDIDSKEEYLELELYSYYEFGSCIEIENHIYTVISVNIVFMNGKTSYSYKICRQILEEPIEEKNCEFFYVGLANVVNNEDPENLGRIQVEFLDFEDSLPSVRIWAAYLNTFTEHGGGVVFIPDKGETVSVFVENGNCYVNGCVRKTAIDSRFQNVKNRTICVRDKVLIFSDEQIELNGFGYRIEVREKGVYVSGENIDIDIEKDKMKIGCGDCEMKIDKTNIKFQSKSEVAIKADEICLDGSSKITAKTSSFDVG